MKLAKADLVTTTTNLLDDYLSFTELAWACERFCEQVNHREHRETRGAPVVRLAAERQHLHVLPAAPHTLALGEERLVKKDQTVSWGGVRHSTPPGWRGQRVWCRAQGEELVIVGRGPHGLEEVCRHRLSTPATTPSWTSTPATLVAGTCTPPSPSPAPLRRSPSFSSARAPIAGWWRPPRPVLAGCAARWLRPSSYRASPNEVASHPTVDPLRRKDFIYGVVVTPFGEAL